MNVPRIVGGTALAALGFLTGALTFYKRETPPGTNPAASGSTVTASAAGPQNAPNQSVVPRTFTPGHGLDWYKKLVSAPPAASGSLSELQILESLAPVMSLTKDEVMELLKDPSLLRALGPPPNSWEGALLMRLSRLDPAAALAYLKKNPDQDGGVMTAVLCQGIHSPGLDECVADLATSGQRGHSLQVLLAEMHATGGDALAFLYKHKDLVWTGSADRFLADLRARDPRKASEASATFFADLKNEERSQKSLIASVRAWAEKEPAAAEAWVHSLTGAARPIAAVSLVDLRMESDLPAAADAMRTLVAEYSAPGTEPGRHVQIELIRGVNSTIQGLITRESVQRASDWCATLPAGFVRQQGCCTIVQHWLEKEPDLQAATAWATALTDQRDRDAVAPLIARRIVASDPPAAVEWAKSVSNPDDRRGLLTDILAAWRKDDPQAATAAESALPAGLLSR